MSYDQLMYFNSYFIVFAWLFAAVVSFFLRHPYKSSGSTHLKTGWTLVMLGSLIVSIRMVWLILPGYKEAEASELWFNMYMLRYLIGAAGAILIGWGMLLLIINYFIIKVKMEN